MSPKPSVLGIVSKHLDAERLSVFALRFGQQDIINKHLHQKKSQ